MHWQESCVDGAKNAYNKVLKHFQPPVQALIAAFTFRLIQRFDLKLAPHEDGTRILKKTKDHFTVDLGDCDVLFSERQR